MRFRPVSLNMRIGSCHLTKYLASGSFGITYILSLYIDCS